MESSCTIREDKAEAWNWIMGISIAVTLLFFILYAVFSNTVLAGFSRLIAFAGFATLVIAYLQTRGRTDQIKLTVDDKNLVVRYFQSSEKKQEELFDVKTIDEIKCRPAPPIWKIIPRNNSSEFRISFTDSENILNMFRVDGRDIYIRNTDVNLLKHFLVKNIQHLKFS